jgi:hypothetical protein
MNEPNISAFHTSHSGMSSLGGRSRHPFDGAPGRSLCTGVSTTSAPAAQLLRAAKVRCRDSRQLDAAPPNVRSSTTTEVQTK